MMINKSQHRLAWPVRRYRVRRFGPICQPVNEGQLFPTGSPGCGVWARFGSVVFVGGAETGDLLLTLLG